MTATRPAPAVGGRIGTRGPERPFASFDAVTIAYGAREVLRDASFEIAPGERVALLGPNGAGKSTLLRGLLGLVRPASGSIVLDGRPIERFSRHEIALRAAVVPQQAVLPFATRVEEVVALGRLPHERSLTGIGPTDRAAIASAIERVGVGHLLGRDARELSLGERQLVLVAMAVAQATPLMILDEPTAHLDVRHQVGVMELLADLNVRDGVTVLAVLHDLTLARHFFPRSILLDRGAIVADGPTRDVLSPERIGEVFQIDPSLVGLGAAPLEPPGLTLRSQDG